MKNISLSLILDSIISFVAIFFGGFCILRALSFNLAAAITLSLLFGLCVSSAITIGGSRKRSLKLIETDLKTEKRTLNNRLALMEKSEIIELFADILQKDGIDTVASENGVEACDVVLVPLFLPDATDSAQIAEAVRPAIKKAKTVAVVSASFTPSAVNFSEESDIKLIGIDEVYDLFKGVLPPAENGKTSAPTRRLKRLLEKRSGTRLILYGAFLCAFGLFAFYPVFYAACGAAFIGFGLIVRFFGKPSSAAATTFSSLFDNQDKKEN